MLIYKSPFEYLPLIRGISRRRWKVSHAIRTRLSAQNNRTVFLATRYYYGRDNKDRPISERQCTIFRPLTPENPIVIPARNAIFITTCLRQFYRHTLFPLPFFSGDFFPCSSEKVRGRHSTIPPNIYIIRGRKFFSRPPPRPGG